MSPHYWPIRLIPSVLQLRMPSPDVWQRPHQESMPRFLKLLAVITGNVCGVGNPAPETNDKNMKMLRNSVAVGLLTCVVAAGVTPEAWAAKSAGAKVEFGEFTPPQAGGEFVEVNIGNALFSMAAKLVEKQEPEASKLLSNIESVRVNVVGIDEGNRSSLQSRTKELKSSLQKGGWEKIVTAQQKGQDVNVYLKTDGKDAVEGLTVVVFEEDKQAVFVNVVGNIRPEQLAMIGERFHVDALKKVGEAVEK